MASVSCFDFLGSGASEMLSPQPGIELRLSALEGEVLTTGLPRKPPELCFSSSGFCLMPLVKKECLFNMPEKRICQTICLAVLKVITTEGCLLMRCRLRCLKTHGDRGNACPLKR